MIININCLADTPGYLLKLIEDAYEIHIHETCATNFIYHCQCKKIMAKNKINLHLEVNNRSWPYLNFDYAYKMYTDPKLDNWNFIFK